MVKRCCAYGCRNSTADKDKKTSFHMFPVDSDRKDRWAAAVNRILHDGLDWVPLPTSVICGEHFVNGRPSRDRADIDYIPTLFDFSSPISKRGEKIHKGQRDQLLDGTLYVLNKQKTSAQKAARKSVTNSPFLSPPTFVAPGQLNVLHDMSKVNMFPLPDPNHAAPLQMPNMAAMPNPMPNSSPFFNLSQPYRMPIPPNYPPSSLVSMMTQPGAPNVMNPIVIQPEAQSRPHSQGIFPPSWPPLIPLDSQIPLPQLPPLDHSFVMQPPLAPPAPPTAPVLDTTPSPAPSTSKTPETLTAKKKEKVYKKVKRVRLPGPRAHKVPEYRESIYECHVEGKDETHKIKLSRSQTSSYKEHSYRDPDIQNLFRASDLLEKRKGFIQAAFEVFDIYA